MFIRLFLFKYFALNQTIYAKDLTKIYGKRTVTNKVSFQVVGLVKPDDGDVFLNDINITKLPMYKRAKMGLGYLPQEASVFRKLTVEDNIAAVLEMTKLTRKEQKEKLETLILEFNLGHVRKSNGDVLS